jgi:hypothetical protein
MQDRQAQARKRQLGEINQTPTSHQTMTWSVAREAALTRAGREEAARFFVLNYRSLAFHRGNGPHGKREDSSSLAMGDIGEAANGRWNWVRFTHQHPAALRG